MTINKNKLPIPPGPYRVGFADFELPAVEPQSFGKHRCKRKEVDIDLVLQTIRFAVFYPVELSRKEAKKRYHRPDWLPSPQWRNAHGYSISTAMSDSVTWPLTLTAYAKTAHLKMRAFEGAPLAGPSDSISERLPVIFFSHGLDGSSRAYSSILGAWASFGFVVISLEHRDGSAPRAYIDPAKMPDGAPQDATIRRVEANGRPWLRRSYLVPQKPAYSGKKAPDWLNSKDPSLIFRRSQLAMRVAELFESVEMVKRLDAGELDGLALVDLLAKGRRKVDRRACDEFVKQFAGRLDLKHDVIISGHSFGGATAVEVMRFIEHDSLPFRAGILLDPWTQVSPVPPKEFIPESFDLKKIHPVRSTVPDEQLQRRTGIQVPLLTISSTFFRKWDEVMPYTDAICKEAGKSVKRCVHVEVKGSNHIAQSDASLLVRKTLWFMPTVMTADAKRAMNLNVKASVEFLGRTLELPVMQRQAYELGKRGERQTSVFEGNTRGIKTHYKVWDA